MLKATILEKPNQSYTKKTKKMVDGVEVEESVTVFRYSVTGSAEEMAAYEKAKGKYHRVDDKTNQVLFFTTDYIGDVIELLILSDGAVIIDKSDLEKAKAIVSAGGGNLGAEIAKAYLNRFTGGSQE
jgi:hypothetical protein